MQGIFTVVIIMFLVLGGPAVWAGAFFLYIGLLMISAILGMFK